MAENKSKEEMILDAAKKVIGEKGFYNMKMDDIAKSVGMAKGTLYIYFKSKDELFIRLIEREYNKIFEVLHDALDTSDDVVSKIDAVIEGFLRHMEKNRAFFISIMYEAPTIKKECIKGKIHKTMRMLNDSMRKIVEEGIKEGLIRDDVDITVLVSAITGIATRVVFYAINFEEKRPFITFKDSILKVIFAGILKEKGGILW